MKKILYTALAIAGLFASTSKSSGQTIADIEVVMVNPVGSSSSPFAMPCTDSFDYEYILINKGPGTIGATDTVLFFSPFVDSGYVNYTVHGGTAKAANDTIAHFAGRNKLSSIKRLVNVSSGAWEYAPFADGDHAFLVLAAGYAADTTVIKDTEDSNDVDFSVVKIACSSGINNTNLVKSNLLVFPNPAQNQISFKSDFSFATNASMRITDIAGRVVKAINLGKQNAGTRTFTVDIADLNNGMYYIELVTESRRSISKFTKN